MKNEEKIRLKIEKLKAQSDFHKWEYGQYTAYLIGLSAILIGLLSTDKTFNLPNILFILVIILLFFIFFIIIKCYSKKPAEEIQRLSKEIENNYNQLEKI